MSGQVPELWQLVRQAQVMSTRYGTARSPQPTAAHTCARRRQLHKGWSNPTSQDDCPACEVDRREGWAELLASIRRELYVHGTHGE
jgi:hypothetical protein